MRRREIPVRVDDTLHKILSRYQVYDLTAKDIIENNPDVDFTAPKLSAIRQKIWIPWPPILVQVTMGELKHIAKYFAVPKDLELARAIFNGRSLGRKCIAPMPVNLPYLPDLIRRVAHLAEGNGVSILTADFRHWFHSIPVSKFLSEHFGISVRGRFFRWRTLPMGWLFSPTCAQQIALAILLFKENSEDDLFIIPEITQLPTYIALREGGFLCVYYDNMFVVALQFSVLKKVALRIERNCRLFEAQIKEGSWTLVGPRELLKSPVDYLGASMSLVRGRNDHFYLQWCQGAKGLSRWRELKYPPLNTQTPWTTREVSSLISRILWRRALDLRPQKGTGLVISLLRRVASERHHRQLEWNDREVLLTESECSTLQDAWARVLLNEPHSLHDEKTPLKKLYLATDSCTHGWGYVIFDQEGNIVEELGGEWNNKWIGRHIFMKELRTAIKTLCSLAVRFPNTLFIAGQDNSAAAAALRNRFSGCVEACTWLDNFYEHLHQHGCTLTTIGLRSEDNASDPASRRVYHDERFSPAQRIEWSANAALRKRCWTELLSSEKGHRSSQYTADPSMSGDGIRHTELMEDDNEVDPDALMTRILEDSLCHDG